MNPNISLALFNSISRNKNTAISKNLRAFVPLWHSFNSFLPYRHAKQPNNKALCLIIDFFRH